MGRVSLEALQTSTNQVKVREYESQVEIVNEEGVVSFNPRSLSEEESMVLADTFLKVLEVSAPVLRTLRQVYIEPVTDEFSDGYREVIDCPTSKKVKEDLLEKMQGLSSYLDTLVNRLEGVESQTKALVAIRDTDEATSVPISSKDDKLFDRLGRI